MSEYIWKYLSLDKFISLLENSGLYFPTIKNLKNNIDPEECCIFDYYTNIKKQELKENNNLPIGINKKILEYHNSLNKIKQDAINNIFVCSFTNDDIENYALWKIYPTDLNGMQQINQGIAIKIRKSYFNELLQNPYFVMNDGTVITSYRLFIKTMNYQPREKIIDLAKSLDNLPSCSEFYNLIHSLKLEYYQYEKEVRAVLQLLSENKNCCNGGFLKFDLKKLFDKNYSEIILSPFAQKCLSDYVKFLLEKHKIDGQILVDKSSILV